MATFFFRNQLGTTPLFTHGVAYVSNGKWWHCGINSTGAPAEVPGNPKTLISIRKWILNTYGDTSPKQTSYKTGTAYKRIILPCVYTGTLNKHIDQNAREQSFVALTLLLNKLQEIFQTVEPSSQNLNTYGHKLRELMILACTEVEASWTGILRANKYRVRRMTTKDYVKLCGPMLLKNYTLQLTPYPKFPAFRPFELWDSKNPTKSIPWYDAYNKTKHDREKHLNEATLEKTIHAVGAVVILFYSQFGSQVPIDRQNLLSIKYIFEENLQPPDDSTSVYIANHSNAHHTSDVWKAIHYNFA